MDLKGKFLNYSVSWSGPGALLTLILDTSLCTSMSDTCGGGLGAGRYAGSDAILSLGSD